MNQKYIFTRILTTLRCNNKFPSADRLLICTRPLNIFKNDNRYKGLKTICNTRHRTLQPYANNYDCPVIFSSAYKIDKKYRLNHLTNLLNKFKTLKLWYQHDPDFSINSFERGTKQVSNQSFSNNRL